MISLRTIVVSLMSLAFAAFALPGLAQSPAKQHSIDVTPTLPPAPSPSPNVFVTITNETPASGNSTINSFVITVPSGVIVADPKLTPSDNPGATVEKRFDGRIYVSGFTGLKSGRRDPYFYRVKLRANYGTLTCSSAYTWTSVAYAGNSFGQEIFDPVIGAGVAGVTNTPTNARQTYGCYKVEVTPASVAKGSSTQLNAKVTNLSATPITSVTLTAPAGISPSITTVSPTFTSGVANVPINAVVSCNAAGGTWVSTVLPAGFTRSTPDTTMTTFGACELKFSGLPTSIAPGAPFDVGIKLVDGNGAPISGFGGTVTLQTTVSGCTLSGATSGTAEGGAVTINDVKLTIAEGTPNCELTATTSYERTPYTASSGALKVFNGVLSCTGTPFNALTRPTSGQGTFSGSIPANITDANTAYLEGARGFGNNKPGQPGGDKCTDINYSIVNNIPTGNTAWLTDPLGNKVPPNGISLVWDTNIAPNPILTYQATFRSEWGDPETGLPTRKTKFCKPDPTTDKCVENTTYSNFAPVKACLGTDVVHASVPAGEKACIVRETWTVIPFDVNFPTTGGPYYCDLTKTPAAPNPAPAGWEPACVQVTTIFLDGKDPVMIRD